MGDLILSLNSDALNKIPANPSCAIDSKEKNISHPKEIIKIYRDRSNVQGDDFYMGSQPGQRVFVKPSKHIALL